jgi:hypothetical protein
MEKQQGNISICRGMPVNPMTVFGPTLPGGGYGKNQNITTWVDRIAEKLHERYPGLDIQKRCNSHGESGGAFLHPRNDFDFGITVGPDFGWKNQLRFNAMFNAEISDLEKIRNELIDDEVKPYIFRPDKEAQVYSRAFRNFDEALKWLSRYGGKYNPHLKECIEVNQDSADNQDPHP